MTNSTAHLLKLDDQLSHLLGKSYYAPDQKIPVALTADSESFDELTAAILHCGGTVRHVLSLVGAISAWVPLEAIDSLSRLAIVKEIELDQQVHIA